MHRRGAPPGLRLVFRCTAGSGYVMLDVGRVRGGDSPPDDVVSLVIGIEKMSSLEEGYATLLEVFGVLRGSEHRGLRRVFHEWFGLLAGQGAGGAAIEGFEEMERQEEAGELRTPVQDRDRRVRAWQEAERAQGRAEGVERGRAEGVEQGRAEGVEQGRAEGVEQERVLLRRLTERKFGVETAGRLAALLSGIEDPKRLADVGDWIIDCASGDELIARVESAA